MADLKPCPFCGSEAKTWATKMLTPDMEKPSTWSPLEWSVGCCNNQCGARLHPFFQTEAGALSAWNRRTPIASSPAA